MFIGLQKKAKFAPISYKLLNLIQCCLLWFKFNASFLPTFMSFNHSPSKTTRCYPMYGYDKDDGAYIIVISKHVDIGPSLTF